MMPHRQKAKEPPGQQPIAQLAAYDVMQRRLETRTMSVMDLADGKEWSVAPAE